MSRRKKYNPDLINTRITSGNFDLSEYAKSMIDAKASLRGTQASVASLTADRVTEMLSNPSSNFDGIASAMEAQAIQDGLLKATLNYFSTSLTLNHSIYPDISDTKDTFKKVNTDEYLSVASYLEKYNLKFFVPYFIYRTLIKGVSFFYEIQDSNGVAYLEFPNSWCRISYLENGVYRWMLDVSKVKNDLLTNPSMPKEIIKAIETNDKTDTKKWIDGKYLLLSDKAIAFTFDMAALVYGGVTLSEFVSMLPNSLLANKIKQNIDVKDKLDSIRIIHGQIPTDSQGVIKMTASDAAEFAKILKMDLPDGIQVAVTPFDLDNVSLAGAGTSKAFDNLKDAQNQVIKSIGVSPQMFGEDTKSSNAIKLGITRDMALIYKKILPVFSNYYNQVLSKAKTASGSRWRIKILEQNYFTFTDDVKQYKESVSLGGSRTDYLASIGMNPLEIYTKLFMEQNVLDIDKIMKPKEMSYTLSGNSSGAESEDVGRPKTDNPTDDTERLSDAD
ncbi:TPA: hypothetical protein ACGO1T_000524 [Streptococcus suis]